MEHPLSLLDKRSFSVARIVPEPEMHWHDNLRINHWTIKDMQGTYGHWGVGDSGKKSDKCAEERNGFGDYECDDAETDGSPKPCDPMHSRFGLQVTGVAK